MAYNRTAALLVAVTSDLMILVDALIHYTNAVGEPCQFGDRVSSIVPFH